MPLALRKESTVKISLDSDNDIPEKERPLFVFKNLTGRQQRELAEKLDDFHASMKNVETMENVFKIIECYLVGWENIPIEFSKKNIQDVLQWQEAQELIFSFFSYSPRLETLKNLGLQLPTLLDTSAEQQSVESAKIK